MGHVYDLLKFSLKQEGRDDIVCFHRSNQLIFGRLPKNFYNDHCLVTIAAVIILSYLIVQIQRLSFIMILFFVLILLEQHHIIFTYLLCPFKYPLSMKFNLAWRGKYGCDDPWPS